MRICLVLIYTKVYICLKSLTRLISFSHIACNWSLATYHNHYYHCVHCSECINHTEFNINVLPKCSYWPHVCIHIFTQVSWSVHCIAVEMRWKIQWIAKNICELFMQIKMVFERSAHFGFQERVRSRLEFGGGIFNFYLKPKKNWFYPFKNIY